MSTNTIEQLLRYLLHCSIFKLIGTEADTYRLINNYSYNGNLLWLHIIRIIICPADGYLASWIKLPFEQLLNIREHFYFFLSSSISHEITEITWYLIAKIQIHLKHSN